MPPDTTNELTFVARLGTVTALRAERKREADEPFLIASGEVEEKQLDELGRVRRCDIRLNTRGGRKLASGEVKRPEVPEGRDPRNPTLVADARRKAIARGLPYYFTCNFAEVVLFAVTDQPGRPDREEAAFRLAPITHSSEVDAYMEEIAANWVAFLDDLEGRLLARGHTRPSVTNADVIALRDAIYAIVEECIARVENRLASDKTLAEATRLEAHETFGFPTSLNPTYRAQFREEIQQILRFGVFVVGQKLVLYRVLQDAGPRRRPPFALDPLTIPHSSSDPAAVKGIIDLAVAHAIDRSRDYETAFLPSPVQDLVFLRPSNPQEVMECRVGEVWSRLLAAVEAVSWVSISQNLLGFLYEVIVDPQFRHELGQFYTREDVVDVLVTFAVRGPADVVIDPAAGGGSFLRAAYQRKRDLGATHEEALAETWAFEIAAFAAELSTISLATADTHEPAAYPRVLLRDFFDARPGERTELKVPGVGDLTVPTEVDAVIGNPPYISYRRQTNQAKVLNALATLPRNIVLPEFSGKSDAYVWFVVHATQFLAQHGRLAFVLSSALLFSDYGIPLIRFISQHYKIVSVIDSMVERWFPDADTNNVLLMLERETDSDARQSNDIRFVRLRRPLAQLIPPPGDPNRRQVVEDLIETLVGAPAGSADPRWVVTLIEQGEDGGLEFAPRGQTLEMTLGEDDDEDEE